MLGVCSYGTIPLGTDSVFAKAGKHLWALQSNLSDKWQEKLQSHFEWEETPQLNSKWKEISTNY